MKPENMLEALNDLNDGIIEDALSSPYLKKRRLVHLLVAAALIAAMSVTVYAVHGFSQWYQAYFEEDSKAPLNQEQQSYLESNVIQVAEPQEGLTIESALTDGVLIYMKLHVTAPEDVSLVSQELLYHYAPGNGKNWDFLEEGFDRGNEDVVTLHGEVIYNSLQYLPVEDGDRLDNTMDFVVLGMLEGGWDMETRSQKPLNLEGETITVRFEDLWRHVLNENDGSFWEEQVLEGEWSFEIPVTKENLKTRELISEPLDAELQYIDMEAEEKTMAWEPVSLTAVTLRPLCVDIFYENSQGEGSFGWEIQAVMKNGEQITLDTQYGGHEYTRYFARSPIVIDQVDHLILGKGTVVEAS